MLSVVFTVFLTFVSLSFSLPSPPDHWNCTHPIYCGGIILETLQLRRLFPDQKTLVDRPLLQPPHVVKDSFHARFPQPSEATTPDLLAFVDEFFAPVASDIIPAEAPEEPLVFGGIADRELADWASEVTAIWTKLLRRTNHTNPPDQYSSFDFPHPFVVPGGRFGTFYYWDSFFILKGLLASKMYKTANYTISNFFHILSKVGFVPNGMRNYFVSRSQLPLLTPMVHLYMNVTGDKTYLHPSYLALLDLEYQFWHNYRRVDLSGDGDYLSHFSSTNEGPRPESYWEDLQTNPTRDKNLFLDITAAAESGMDFSTRWLRDEHAVGSIASIETRNVIPVDLNTILFWVEMELSSMFREVGDTTKENDYFTLAAARSTMMTKYLWDESDGCWYDYDIQTKGRRKRYSITNFFPAMFAGLYDPNLKTIKIPDRVFSFIGGVPITFAKSEQQWDYPNAWAPSTYFFSEALKRMPGKKDLHFIVVQSWISNAYCGFKKASEDGSHLMYEKYNVDSLGNEGKGGEYKSQFGFGWTNGVTLDFLQQYGSLLDANSCADVEVFVLILTIGTVSVAMVAVALITVFILVKQCCCDITVRSAKTLYETERQREESLLESQKEEGGGGEGGKEEETTVGVMGTSRSRNRRRQKASVEDERSRIARRAMERRDRLKNRRRRGKRNRERVGLLGTTNSEE